MSDRWSCNPTLLMAHDWRVEIHANHLSEETLSRLNPYR